MMDTYIIIMLPIAGIYFVVMFVLLFNFERAKRQYEKMINEGFYFVRNGGFFIGIAPEVANNLGLSSDPGVGITAALKKILRMEIYLIILLPISTVFLLCMLILLILFQKVRRQTLHMINGGYYFIQKGDSYVGIPPEYIEEAGFIPPNRENINRV